MDPLLLVLIVAGVTCAFCWIASLITKDTSWVDRIWSIVPGRLRLDLRDRGHRRRADAARLLVMAVLVTAWGARLTFNFARKGGYTGMEDYRWAVLRGRMKPWQFQVFNLFFIVLYQNALLVLITLPALHRLAASRRRSASGMPSFAVLFAALPGRRDDRRPAAVGLPPGKKAPPAARSSPGSSRPGCSRYSRHPNFFFEQAQWWAFYAIGATAAVASGLGLWGGALNWTIAGPALLTCSSSARRSSPSRSRRRSTPRTPTYRRTTSMLVPLPRRRARAGQALA